MIVVFMSFVLIVYVVTVFVVFPVSSILVALFLVLLISYLLVLCKVVHDTDTILEGLELELPIMKYPPPNNIFFLSIVRKLNSVYNIQ